MYTYSQLLILLQDMCKILDSNLVEIDNVAENNYLTSQISLKGSKS